MYMAMIRVFVNLFLSFFFFLNNPPPPETSPLPPPAPFRIPKKGSFARRWHPPPVERLGSRGSRTASGCVLNRRERRCPRKRPPAAPAPDQDDGPQHGIPPPSKSPGCCAHARRSMHPA